MLPYLRLDGVVAHRPAVPAAILLILGISLHRLAPTYPLLWLCFIAISVLCGVLSFRHEILCSAFIAIAILGAGLVSAQLANSFFPRNHINAFASDESRLGWVEARIEETPRIIEPPPRGRVVPDKQLFQVSVRSVLTWKGWESAQGEMQVRVSPPQPDLATGQVVRMLGRIERPLAAMNPGQFDAAERDRRQRLLVSMRVSKPYEVRIISQSGQWAAPMTSFRATARSLLKKGFKDTHSEDRALLTALVFGDREPALRDVEDYFNGTGTSHLLAANGARIAMLGLIIYTICLIVRLPPRRAAIVLTVCIALSAFLTMPVPQALRPAIVCVALGLGWVHRRTTDSLHLLAMAALTVLVLRPLELYGAGFQLSFVIVSALILLTRPVLEFLERLKDEDKRVVESFLPPTAWRIFQKWVRRKLLELLAAALISWLVAIPLVSFHFEQFNLWTVPFGILLTPFAMLALAAGFAKLALTAVCSPLAAAWATLAMGPASLLRHLVAALARIPLADVPIPSPSLGMMLVFYLLLCLPLISWPRRRVRWMARCAPLCGCAALLFPPLSSAPLSHGTPTGGVRVTLLSVGAGQCAVVEPSGGGAVILDAGSLSMADPLRACISPFLRHEGRWSIDSIWLSHGDYDHIGAVEQIVPAFGVRHVITSPHFSRHAADSVPCRMLLTTLQRQNRSPRLVTQGDRAALGDSTRIEVLWPPADCDFKPNDAALVLKVTCGGRSILFPADIQERAERELLKHPELLKSDVLIAPHHGSAEATTAQFIRAVNPKVILSSNDARLTMKQRLFDADVADRPLYRTSRYGAITVEIDKDGGLRITPYRGGQGKTIAGL